MVDEEVYVQGKYECSKSESRGAPPYGASAAQEALPDAIDKAMVAHAVGGSIIFEKDGQRRRKISLLNT